jgi:hypothetical protein
VKFKEEIKTIDSVISKIMNVQSRSYKFTEDTKYGEIGLSEGKHYGFVAQELEEVFPELVTDEIHPGTFNDETGEESEPIQYKGVKYMEMIPILLKAIQEQQDMIEELKDKVDRLEGKK